jgi:glutamyl/glutaminyl-tRNA synthetase
LSKRHGATSLEEFRQRGYLPDALANYLALLGWSPAREGEEIMPLREIAGQFDLSRVLKHPAVFDGTKLDWMNRQHIARTPAGRLADRAAGFFQAAGLLPAELDEKLQSWFAGVVEALKTRVDHLDQFVREAEIIYGFPADPPPLEEKVRDLLSRPDERSVAEEFARLAGESEVLTPEKYRQIVGRVKTATGQKGRRLFHPIRAALTGRDAGPEMDLLIPLYEEGSRLNLPRKVMSCRERLQAVLRSV